MAGKQYPLTLIPRYTTYAGASTFRTLPMDVSPFESAIVNVWMGTAVGTTPLVTVVFEESTDLDGWATCAGGSSFTPLANSEVQKTITLSRRYLRISVTLSGTGVAATLYALGYLVARVH